ncbi:hypothetical protein PIB30_028090 [Stylosanthes scabra]|uniref:Uncharacterized protein n=1 Tax=Stylosanthes scabra TaxID=79078 RepID=A0ABU6TBK9_9FABA|nr:hypothetical protein [Stylosanthes scabra]
MRPLLAEFFIILAIFIITVGFTDGKRVAPIMRHRRKNPPRVAEREGEKMTAAWLRGVARWRVKLRLRRAKLDAAMCEGNDATGKGRAATCEARGGDVRGEGFHGRGSRRRRRGEARSMALLLQRERGEVDGVAASARDDVKREGRQRR